MPTSWWAEARERPRKWLAERDGILLLGMAGVAFALWIFAAIADEIAEGEAIGVDEWMFRVLRPDDPNSVWRSSFVVSSLSDITALGGVPVLTVLVIFALGYLFLDKKHHAALMLLAAVLGGAGLTTGLKLIFARARPEVVEHLVKVQTFSFPSGHAMLSTIVYLTLAAILARTTKHAVLRLYFITAGALMALLIGFSRVFVGVHYPTDVVAGWAVGLAWAMICWLVARRLQRTGKVEPAS